MHSVIRYKLLFKKLFFTFIVLGFTSTHLLAGSFNSPAPVTDSASKIYTIEDIYNRLESGAAGTNTNTKNTFAEPTVTPASSSKDLNDVMSKAPAVNNATGATTDEVINGKKFWSLNSGAWGVQTGSSTGIMASGNASDANVLAGKTYSNDSGNRTGSMVNATQNVTPGNTEKTINAGYHDGTGKVATDANLTASNIKNGSTLFGVTGSYTGIGGNVQDTSTGDAVATEILSGKKAWVDGNEVTGNVPIGANITGDDGLKTLTISNGLYLGDKTATANDNDLTTTNIKNSIVIFGVTGSYTGIGGNVQDTSSGDAVATDILSGKKAWVNGEEVTGTNTTISSYPSPVSQTNQQLCYNDITNASETCDILKHDGQDGLERRGKAWVNPRFTDNNNGTITDNNTGLIWLKDASCADLGTNSNGSDHWFAALSAPKTLAHGTCGLSDNSSAGDWHLPNLFELESLIDPRYIIPPISNTIGTSQWTTEGDPFIGLTFNIYWTSSTFSAFTNMAWAMMMSIGVAGEVNKTIDQLYIWPVRGGQ